MKCYLAVKYVLRFLASTTGHVMSAAMFFVQFVDWWYTSDTRTPIATATQVPPPNFKVSNNQATKCIKLYKDFLIQYLTEFMVAQLLEKLTFMKLYRF